MTPERWQQVQTVFDAALLRNPADWPTFLAEACAGDGALRDEVGDLLARHQRAGDERPTGPASPAPDGAPADARIGQRLGPYRVTGRVASGGMGTVYRAVRVDDYRQEVAVKVIKAGHDSDEVLHRFRIERQVLADLRHPHVARLLDGGSTPDGLPYLVMEFIDGEPIDLYCDGRGLPTRERVQLLRQVCLAVQHAHERSVVHRDLKPANVLVTADGVPKVTDFGLAKHLGPWDDDEAAAALPPVHAPTQTGDLVGTPGYMAPEQAAGKAHASGPAADVYALGAVLYRLLTGRPPFRAESTFDTLHQVLHDDPVPPSRLHPGLARDLETVCLKCLRKDPRQRYATAGDLADELGRFLAGEPIQARPVGTTERLGRWCRRHPVLASTGALALAALLAFAGYQALVAARLRQKEQEIRAGRAELDLFAAETFLERGIALCEEGHVGRGMLLMARSLERSPPDAADFHARARTNLAGWRDYLNPLQAILPQEKRVHCFAFSPDRRLLLTGGADSAARLWDLATGEPHGSPLRHKHRVTAAAFSPDGQRVLTGAGVSLAPGGEARFWDAQTGKPLGEPILHDAPVRTVTFSPDGRFFLTGCEDSTARLWDAGTRSLLNKLVLPKELISQALFSPDGQMVLLSTRTEKAALWNVRDALARPVFLKHDGPVSALAFAPDGKTVITGCALGETGQIRRWDVARADLLGEPIFVDGNLDALAMTLDGGKVLACGRDHGATRVWEIDLKGPRGTVLPHASPVLAVAFDSDGTRAVTAGGKSDVGDRGEVHLWDVPAGNPVAFPFDHKRAVGAVTFVHDDQAVLTASVDNDVSLWDLRNKTRVSPYLPIVGTRMALPLALSPDGKRILAGAESGFCQFWDVPSRTRLDVALRHEAPVYAAVFRPTDGRLVLTGCQDGLARLWDAATGQLQNVSFVHRSQVRGVAFRPDGAAIVTGSDDRTARLWDAATGQRIGQVLRHRGGVWAVAFSPDGRLVLTGSGVFGRKGGEARLWDAATGKPLGPPLPHGDIVRAVAFHPREQRILTGSEDGTARLWDIPEPLPGDVERLRVWLEVLTGTELEDNDTTRPLDLASWQQRRRRLQELGGPPG